MDKKSEEEVRTMLRERRKWKAFFEILTRRYIFGPIILFLVFLIDDKNINIMGAINKFIKGLI